MCRDKQTNRHTHTHTHTLVFVLNNPLLNVYDQLIPLNPLKTSPEYTVAEVYGKCVHMLNSKIISSSDGLLSY